jgi:hypothetical protein
MISPARRQRRTARRHEEDPADLDPAEMERRPEARLRERHSRTPSASDAHRTRRRSSAPRPPKAPSCAEPASNALIGHHRQQTRRSAAAQPSSAHVKMSTGQVPPQRHPQRPTERCPPGGCPPGGCPPGGCPPGGCPPGGCPPSELRTSSGARSDSRAQHRVDRLWVTADDHQGTGPAKGQRQRGGGYSVGTAVDGDHDHGTGRGPARD